MRDTIVLHDEIVEAYSEATWLLREKVAVILNGCQLLTERQEVFGELVGDYCFESVVEEFEAGSKEVGFNIANKVLAIHSEVIAATRDGEITIFSHSLSEELTVIRSNKGAIRLFDRFGTLCFICEGFALMNKSVKVRIITKDTLF